MPQFRKKPVVIEAWQYVPEIVDPRQEGVCRCNGVPPHLHTAHEGQTVVLSRGDWIVPESKAPGRFYPIKPDVFEATYDAV